MCTLPKVATSVPRTCVASQYRLYCVLWQSRYTEALRCTFAAGAHRRDAPNIFWWILVLSRLEAAFCPMVFCHAICCTVPGRRFPEWTQLWNVYLYTMMRQFDLFIPMDSEAADSAKLIAELPARTLVPCMLQAAEPPGVTGALSTDRCVLIRRFGVQEQRVGERGPAGESGVIESGISCMYGVLQRLMVRVGTVLQYSHFWSSGWSDTRAAGVRVSLERSGATYLVMCVSATLRDAKDACGILSSLRVALLDLLTEWRGVDVLEFAKCPCQTGCSCWLPVLHGYGRSVTRWVHGDMRRRRVHRCRTVGLS